jgi:[ribosomal protein S18]-alanine N-acetyltransferase
MDIDPVHEIEQVCFARPWSRDSFVSEITANACARYVVLLEDGVIAGFGGMWLIIGEAHVNNIAVHPDFRQRGYGRRIMKELMRVAYRAGEIIEMTLEVRVTNVPAIDLYTSMGFEVEGRRRGYYEDNGEDAYIMWCHNTIENLI